MKFLGKGIIKKYNIKWSDSVWEKKECSSYMDDSL